MVVFFPVRLKLTHPYLSAEMVFSLLKSVRAAPVVPPVDPMVARCLSNLTSGGIDAVHAESLCSTTGSAVRNSSGSTSAICSFLIAYTRDLRTKS
jgi:hypothetical protein